MTLQDLHEYQKRLANFIARHPSAIISVDMGLGKTAAVLAWLNWYISRNASARVLIVAPKRVAENNWRQEAEKWQLVELYCRMTICAGNAEKRAKNLNDDTKPIKILSRDNLGDLTRCGKVRNCDVLIIDELTSFKNPDASRSKYVQSVQAKVKIGLTGTFLANGAIDIYGQAKAVGIGWCDLNYYAWRATYFRDALAGSGLAFHKWKLNTPLPDLLKPIQENVFTLTAKDYLQIPPVTHNIKRVTLSDDERGAIEELDAFLATELNGEVLTIDEKSKFAKLQTLCNGCVYDANGEPIRGAKSTKLEAVADFVADCKDAGERVLLFYAYREEFAWLKELLAARKVHAVGVKNDSRFMERWNNGEIDCLLAHPASAGHGLNLQHGGRVIVWSTLTYNYELFAQGNARLARQGQMQNVQIYYFIAAKTCEELVLRALRTKDGEQNEFLKLTKQ